MRMPILIRVWGAFVFHADDLKTVHPDSDLKKPASTVGEEDTPSSGGDHSHTAQF